MLHLSRWVPHCHLSIGPEDPLVHFVGSLGFYGSGVQHFDWLEASYNPTWILVEQEVNQIIAFGFF
jgi:hypothetical protein